MCDWIPLEQTSITGTTLACPGGLLGLLAFFLEDPLGKVASATDLLFLVDGGPQGATSWELVETDGVGGMMSGVLGSQGDSEALSMGMHSSPGGVEGCSWDCDPRCTRAQSDHLGGLLLVQHGQRSPPGLQVQAIGPCPSKQEATELA